MRAECFFLKDFFFKEREREREKEKGGGRNMCRTQQSKTQDKTEYPINMVDVVNICYAVIMIAIKSI